MKILVINCGSSSLKYQLIDMADESVLGKGICERIGAEGSVITHKTADGKAFKEQCEFPNHTAAFAKMVEMMTTGESAIIDDISEIGAIGHRIVQGADRFKESVIVTEEVINTIEEIAPLAPVHNLAHVQGLRSAQDVFGKHVPNVVVFDTAFHATMPRRAYMFAIPYEFYEKHAIRRYGFHGTSHRYVSQKCAEVLGKDIKDLKIITCHLGNGSSIAAVDGGKVVDTSMGLTPLGGLMMGTRSGELDPSVVTYLEELTGMHGNEMSEFLNKKCGFLGVAGVSDNRDIEIASNNGDDRALLVCEMFDYQIKKYIGSYTAAMNGLDAIVFTGGIGENGDFVRAGVCADMEYYGIKIDPEKNKRRGMDVNDFSAPDAKVKTMVIATNEELMIARDTLRVVSENK